MSYCMITFRSVTPAQKGEAILRRAGFTCSIRRTPRGLEEQGCGYSLQVRRADAARAVQLLQAADVHYRKVYLHRENGALEELYL